MKDFFKTLRGPGSGRFRPWSTALITIAASIFLMMGSEVFILALRHLGFCPLEVYGTGNKFLEQRLNYIEEFHEKNGPVRYIFVGNSKVGQGVDTELVSSAYQEETGTPLSCVNFGFGGNTSELLPLVFRILKEDYKPDCFFLELFGPYQTRTFPHEESKWLQYRDGHFNISGWMIDNFHFMRVFLRFRLWMEKPGEDYLLKSIIRDQGRVRDVGLSEERKQELLEKELVAREEVQPTREDPEEKSELLLAEEQFFPQVIDQVGAEKLVFFELPVSFRITRSMDNYNYRLERSEKMSADYGIQLVRMPDPRELPLESWMKDGVHMEREGIKAFSFWLGKVLAEMEQSSPGTNCTREVK